MFAVLRLQCISRIAVFSVSDLGSTLAFRLQDMCSGNSSQHHHRSAAAEGRKIATRASKVQAGIWKFEADLAAQFPDPTYTAAVPAQRLAASGDVVTISSDDEDEPSGAPRSLLSAQLQPPPPSAVAEGADAAATARRAAAAMAEAGAQSEAWRARVAGSSASPATGVGLIASAGQVCCGVFGKLMSPLRSARPSAPKTDKPGWATQETPSSSSGGGGGAKGGSGSDGGTNTACKNTGSQQAARRRAQNKVWFNAMNPTGGGGSVEAAGHTVQADRIMAEQLQQQQRLEAVQQRQPPLSAGPNLPARFQARSSGSGHTGHAHGPGPSGRTRPQSQTTMLQHLRRAPAAAVPSPHTPALQDTAGQRSRSLDDVYRSTC